MPYALFKTISGRDGEVRIPALGALIGTMTSWTLTRRGEDGGAKERLYDLRAVFSYVNPNLWDDPDYRMEVTVKLGRDTVYRLEQELGNPVLAGRSLLWEGVSLHGRDSE